MRARRMRRRLFNLFAFACLAYAIYLTEFSKDDSNEQVGRAAQTTASANKVK
ncbi:hypothetical protein [Niastella sp. OAS944]|uniref:hypothetical protein n=1 Tax=Niastella sp. OAS944 TaxID=2664089 RepID=UPI00346CABF5|nr:hypothetical protein [Chitinophagaceae bacterium OAS944]